MDIILLALVFVAIGLAGTAIGLAVYGFVSNQIQ